MNLINKSASDDGGADSGEPKKKPFPLTIRRALVLVGLVGLVCLMVVVSVLMDKGSEVSAGFGIPNVSKESATPSPSSEASGGYIDPDGGEPLSKEELQKMDTAYQASKESKKSRDGWASVEATLNASKVYSGYSRGQWASFASNVSGEVSSVLWDAAIDCNNRLFSFQSWDKSLNRGLDCVSPDSGLNTMWVLDVKDPNPFISPSSTSHNRIWSEGVTMWNKTLAVTDDGKTALVQVEVSRKLFWDGPMLDKNGGLLNIGHRGGAYSYVERFEKQGDKWVLTALV